VPCCNNRLMFCPNAVVWGDFATWVAGAATVGTLALIGFQWWRQTITEQAKAVHAYLWRDGNELQLLVGNGSGLPVYDVFLFHMMQGSPTALGGASIMRGWKALNRLFPFLRRTLNWWWFYEKMIGSLMKKAEQPPAYQRPEGGLDDVAVLPLLPPGEFQVVKELGHLRMGNKNDFSFMFGVEVVFRDSRGRRWSRRSDGRLKRSRFDPWSSTRIRQGITETFSRTPAYSKIVPLGED
jgi:hypothetical protein